MKMVKLKCENCGASLEVNKDLDKIICNHCGNEILINDAATELRRVEEVKLEARKQNHEQTIKEKKELEELNAASNFKKSILSKILLIFAAICLLIVFTKSFNFASIIALIQAILFIGSWLFGMEIIKQKNKKIYLILALIGFLLIIPFFKFNSSSNNKFDWEDIKLHDMLPEPKSNKGKIIDNSKKNLWLDVKDSSEKDYNNYVDDCKDKGFNVDIEEDTDSFEACNKNGYCLSLRYTKYNKEITIMLEAPMEMKENAWVKTELSNLIPEPKSNYGKVQNDSKTSYVYYAGNTSKSDYDEYVTQVKEIGFDVDYSNQDNYYSAKNASGYKVYVKYQKNKVMYIEVSAPKEEDEKEEPKSADKEEKNIEKEDESSSSKSVGIREDFKNAMDSYEKFIDEYIAVVNKMNSNPTDAEITKSYMSYLEKYTKFVDDFEKWEDEDLNDEETRYYLEVETRVSKKLIKAGLDS